jgi:peroxiredoxin
MQQIVDLQQDANFQTLNVAILSIAFDSAEEQQQGIAEFGISGVPMLVDADGTVSLAYDVLKWAAGTGEPGHTFILVDSQQRIVWIRDYGSPTLPNPTMYVPIDELVTQIAASLSS